MIRIAANEDIESIAEIESECFSAPWTKKMIAEAFENEFNRFFVFVFQNEIAAYIGLTLLIDECEILNLAVKEKFRRQKIAQSLLESAIITAKENNAKTIFLEVNENNLPAIKLYEKNGFKLIRKRNKYYGDDAAFILSKEL